MLAVVSKLLTIIRPYNVIAIIFASKSKTFSMGVLSRLIFRLRSVVPLVTIFLLSLVLLITPGCGGDDNPDVSNINIHLTALRLDQDLAGLDTNNVAAGLQELHSKYRDFLDFYLDTLMGFGINGNFNDSVAGIRLGLQPFLAHKDIVGLFDTVAKHYPDTKQINEDLTRGFQYMKHYYPQFFVPKIIYLITGLNQWSVVTVDTNIIGIGLDMYLGEQYPFYRAVQIPEYVIKKCTPEYVSVNTFQAIYRDRVPFVMEGRTLLDMMIQRGKEQYFLSKVLPFKDERVRLGFTQEQLDWSEASEAMVYNFFVKDNLLYETNWQKIVRYVNDGPSAAGMPAESPGSIGSWLGYQIVKAYVAEHPDATLNDILKTTDAQRFLQESKYKPR